MLQLYVLVADLSVACSVEAGWSPEVQLDRNKGWMRISIPRDADTFLVEMINVDIPAFLQSGSKTFCT